MANIGSFSCTYEAGKKVAGKAGGFLTTAGATAGAIKGFSATAAPGNPLLIAGATIGGGIIGGIGGAGLGAVGNFIFGGNASGGLIQRTGNYFSWRSRAGNS